MVTCMFPMRQLAAVLLSACALAACGGGGSGDTSEGAGGVVVPAADAYFPLSIGSTWGYRRTTVVQGSQQTADVTARITGSQEVDGMQGARLQTLIETAGSSGPDVADENIYARSVTGIRVFEGDPTDRVSTAFNGTYVMVLPAVAGDSYPQYEVSVDSGIDYDADGIHDEVGESSRLLVVGYEDLALPAGSFAKCLHQRQTVRRTFHLSGSGQQVNDYVIDTWYAPGVGRVRSVLQGSDASITDELMTYQISPARS
ncbi:hypothetical protein ASE08_08205 [Rhizobacter sp. Root16D2]|nr:hypothetical protein ASC88_15245 [Rhizobacter sp. Root29]KQW04440.1 hypothetical protein ASC98_04935 [Rhizobacter sp. Root1238]KRB14429.1 hypothetical protein ASE08_08205 [Rhizobacter sp. Root16D2]